GTVSSPAAARRCATGHPYRCTRATSSACCGSYNGRRRHRIYPASPPPPVRARCQGAWASLNRISSLASLGSLGAPVMTLRGSSLGEPVVPVLIEVCVPVVDDEPVVVDDGAASSITLIRS